MTRPLEILYEDNHLLVVNKPALLPTMGVAESERSLHSIACDYLRTKYNKPGNVYLGVVSRLDAFVSGVIVLARTSKAASRLSDQFRRRTVEKTYWAIVPDRMPADAGELQHRVIKNDVEHRMTTIPQSSVPVAGEKLARLSYTTLGTYKDLRLIKVRLETGRKHQIRVQFQAIGCPIVGDQKYDSPLTFDPGIALHSYCLKLEHPTLRESLEFRADPPAHWHIGRFLGAHHDAPP